MDEPTSALDDNNAKNVINLIKNNSNEKKSISLVISHNWNIVKSFERMIKFDQGKIVYDGKPTIKNFR